MESPRIRTFVRLLCLSLIVTAPHVAFASPVQNTLDRPTVVVHNTSKVALLDIARTGNRLVAVGERGIIRLSDDSGQSWRQVTTPVSVSLTAVRFADEEKGWAIGHRGVVLYTHDRGETWVRQLDGVTIAHLMTQFANKLEERGESDNAAIRQAVSSARQAAKDGADKPLLDLYFADTNRGFVIGAYGIALATTDGGKSWEPIIDRIENPRGLHLYAIHGAGNRLYIAGEQGLVLSSNNDGKTFAQVKTPYRGSYFALWVSPRHEVIVAGLNGNAYRSSDAGSTWSKLSIETSASFSAFLELQEGSVLLVDQNGSVFASTDVGQSFTRLGARKSLPISAIAHAADGSLIGVGLLGSAPLSVSTTALKK